MRLQYLSMCIIIHLCVYNTCTFRALYMYMYAPLQLNILNRFLYCGRTTLWQYVLLVLSCSTSKWIIDKFMLNLIKFSNFCFKFLKLYFIEPVSRCSGPFVASRWSWWFLAFWFVCWKWSPNCGLHWKWFV